LNLIQPGNFISQIPKLRRLAKLAAELLEINAMLGGFVRADENHWNIPSVAFYQDGIPVDVYLAQRSAKFGKQRHNRRLGFVAKMTARTSVESNVTLARGGQSRVFGMSAHGFGFEYF
jgi:hypothetical protein